MARTLRKFDTAVSWRQALRKAARAVIPGIEFYEVQNVKERCRLEEATLQASSSVRGSPKKPRRQTCPCIDQVTIKKDRAERRCCAFPSRKTCMRRLQTGTARLLSSGALFQACCVAAGDAKEYARERSLPTRVDIYTATTYTRVTRYREATGACFEC